MIEVFGFPRSGTNWVANSIWKAFYPERDLTGGLVLATTGHWSQRQKVSASPARVLFRDVHRKWRRGTETSLSIYVVRDGRSVAASHYRTCIFRHIDDKDISFNEFLRKPLDWNVSPKNRALRTSPGSIVQHWYDNTRGWRDRAGVHYVHYEEMLSNPSREIQRLGEFLQMKPAILESYPTPSGPDARAEYSLLWPALFSKDDLRYFFSIVPADYWALA